MNIELNKNAWVQDINLQDSELHNIALKAFFDICTKWNLNNEEQKNLLGITSNSTFFKWKKRKEGRLTKDQLERISYILGIYKALKILLPGTADEWIKKPNKHPFFNGKSSLDVMLGGNVADLYIVRKYLDSERGNIYL